MKIGCLLLGNLGALGVILSLFLPFERHPELIGSVLTSDIDYSNLAFYQYITQVTLLQYAPPFALLIAVASVIFVVTLLSRNEKLFKAVAWALCGAVTAAMLYALVDIVGRKDVDIAWHLGLPTYQRENGGSLMGIAWLALSASTLCCLIVAYLGDFQRLFARAAPTRVATRSDTGKCASCGQLNSLQASRCHGCGVVLPWAKTAGAPSTPGQTINQVKAKVSAPGVGEWLQSAGGSVLTFLFAAVRLFWATSCGNTWTKRILALPERPWWDGFWESCSTWVASPGGSCRSTRG